MAISPPSDIVLDVARAVEPTDIDAARAALTKRAAGVAGTFSMDAAPQLSRLSADKTDSPQANKFKHFEAMVLQTFIQNMLPKDTEGVYGKGLAGDMWKSQMAEHIADVMADRGGIGIAKSLLADHYKEGKKIVPVGPVSGGPAKAEVDQQTSLSTSLLHELQRKMARSLTDERLPVETDTKI